MSDCRLLSYPPVGETMHFVGHCYCHLCTCGQHPCPNKSSPKSFLPSSLASTYKKDYKKKPPIPNEPMKPTSPRILSPPQALISTSRADFVAHPTSLTPSSKYEKDSNTGLFKLIGSSNYKHEFPDWKHYEFIHVGRYKRSASKRNINFSPVTTYSSNYVGQEIVRTQSQKRLNERSPIVNTGEFDGQTVNKQSFLPHGKEDFARRASNKNFGIVNLESPKHVYETLYRNSYQRQLSPGLPQMSKDVRN